MSNGGEKAKLGYEIIGTLCLQQVGVGIRALNSLSRTESSVEIFFLENRKMN
jgi:hypothetical protein